MLARNHTSEFEYIKQKMPGGEAPGATSKTDENSAYFFLCLFFLKRFLRLWVAILCLFLFLPLGIVS
jgi:hypothetical protein